jgi:hypothetical protein
MKNEPPKPLQRGKRNNRIALSLLNVQRPRRTLLLSSISLEPDTLGAVAGLTARPICAMDNLWTITLLETASASAMQCDATTRVITLCMEGGYKYIDHTHRIFKNIPAMFNGAGV